MGVPYEREKLFSEMTREERIQNIIGMRKNLADCTARAERYEAEERSNYDMTLGHGRIERLSHILKNEEFDDWRKLRFSIIPDLELCISERMQPFDVEFDIRKRELLEGLLKDPKTTEEEYFAKLEPIKKDIYGDLLCPIPPEDNTKERG